MSQLNILVIDDNRDHADGLGMILEDEGYKVSLAYNGRDGINIFNKGQFDLVLIDVKLPDVSGVVVFRELRKKDLSVRAIMMTGYRIEQILEEVIDDGTVEVLCKPFELERVVDLLGESKKELIVLIADDDPDFSANLSSYLTDQGIENMLARECREAVDGVLSSQAKVLVLDLSKPIIYGLEVYLDLKQRDHVVKTLLVARCKDDDSGHSNSLKSIAVTGCLFKPFRPETLFSSISEIMAR